MTRARDTPPRLPILLVAPQPFYSDRGTPIAVRQVLEALSELGHEVDVLTFPGGRDVDIPDVRIFRCADPLRFGHVPVGFSLRKVVLDFFLAHLLLRRLRAKRYAYVHAVEESAFLAVLAGRRFGLPVLYDMQSSLPEQLARHRVLGLAPLQSALLACERWLLRRATVIVASQGLGERVIGIAPGAKVREWSYSSTFHPVSEEEISRVRQELGIESGARLVLYCGTFEPYQGLSPLLEALPRVAAEVPGTVLALVGGDGTRTGELSRQASLLSTNGHLRILDRQPRERIHSFLAAADVLVSPRAYGSNLPLKVFDYMAVGKPLIVTRSPASEALLGPDLAELVDASPDGFAEAVIGILRDPDRAALLGRNARAFAEEHLCWVRFSDSVRELVKEMGAPGSVRESGR